MNTVGRLGSYITRGVYTVSAPFHPFGGAVDIIAVEQPDGSFKSSPWYISFGKFQGVLKAKEKVVNISVNGVEADFHMYLDQRGEAYFLREVEGEEGESLLSSLSSSDETDGRSMKTPRPVKSKDCNFDSNLLNSVDQDDGGNGKIVVRTKSRRSRIMGSVFGRWSMKEGRIQEGDDGTGIVRIGSLERAEIAADLLELKWSTNLATIKHKKGSGLPFSARSRLDGKGDKDLQIGDERCLVDSSVHDSFKCGMDNGVLAGEIEPRNLEIKRCSELCFRSLGDSVVETSMATGIASLCTTEQVESSMLQEVVVEGRGGVIPEISRNNDKSTSHNADDDDENGEISGVTGHELRMPGVGEACHGKELDDEQTSDEKDVALPGFSISEEDNESNKVQSFICCGTSQSLEVVLNGSNEQTRENGFLAETEPGEVYVQSVTLRATPQLPLEDAANEQAEDVRLEKGNMEASDVSSSQTNPFLCINGHDVSNLDIPVAVLMSDTSTVYVAPMHPLFEATDSQSTDTISSFGNFNYQSKDKKTIRDQTMGNKFQPSLASVMDAELLQVAYSPKRALSAPSSESSEEEQFHFSDLDEFKHDNFLIEKNFANGVDEIGEEVNSLCVTDGEACLSSDKIVQKNDLATSSMETSSASCPVDVPEVHNVFGLDAGRMVESLPNISSPFGSLDANLHSLSHSLELSSEPVEWPLLRKRDGSCSSNVDASIVDQFMHEPSNDEESLKLDNSESGFASGAAGGPAKVIVDSGGSWRMWPFSLKRARSRRTIQPASNDTRSSESEIVLDSTSTMETTCSRLENVSNFNMNINTEKNVLKLKATIKMVKAITPTSKQLASLNLKEGRNTVTFTFSTAMLGKQEVDARIYLWKWNTRIVISDVDGTITKSDVLGQFMPLVGVDWSQTGVANLFSAIKENGYQMLFLSARAISQAYHTRRFLFNLKQDGKTLPDGPVVISPDGLFPSLFREVIRRAPHEFKIACLENIKALFPPDCNPFYAGFGNRDTDEISYIKVGIPRGKIFIINPKGEVAVNRRVDTKSYHSLHDLVHGMFPSKPSFEQEDFNSWNYWKLPPPAVDI